MKRTITGKEINEWAKTNNLPNYWGDKFEWSYKYNKYVKMVKGEFIAKKYNSIVLLIIETKASVNITNDAILIQYSNGQSKINRDILTDSFLLPLININTGFSSIN